MRFGILNRIGILAYHCRYTAVLMRKVVGNSIPKTAPLGNCSLLNSLRPPTSWSYQILLVPSLRTPVSSIGASKTVHIPSKVSGFDCQT
jgi:hypothetical protein